MVMFGNDSFFSQSSLSVIGREDIQLTNTQYSIEITGLDMNTQYYYSVQSTNTDGSITSMESNFNTTILGLCVCVGVCMCGCVCVVCVYMYINSLPSILQDPVVRYH